MFRNAFILTILFLSSWIYHVSGQSFELNQNWVCKNISDAKDPGEKISVPSFQLDGWMPATVPGTVLTTMLNNRLVPDPCEKAYAINLKNRYRMECRRTIDKN